MRSLEHANLQHYAGHQKKKDESLRTMIKYCKEKKTCNLETEEKTIKKKTNP